MKPGITVATDLGLILKFHDKEEVIKTNEDLNQQRLAGMVCLTV